MFTNLANCVWIEGRKVLRSRMPLGTTLGFLLVPLACAFLMFIYKDPEFARKAGIISAKANLVGGTADWPFYLNMIAQALGIGGIMLFSLIASWVFGREFADGTVKDLLAVPVARSTILLAKFIVTGLWSAAMALMVYLVSLTAGALIGLPQYSSSILWGGSLTLLVTTLLVMAVVTPFALLASAGRGYLLPVGIAMLTLALSNVVALIGWGEVFPWAVPALYAGMGEHAEALAPLSYIVVALTGLAGIAGTLLWWRFADQNR
jgi:ABC-2 type transport system permease protein